MDSSTSIYPCVCFLPRWSKQCTVSAEFCQKWRCFHRADVWEWRHESYNVTWLRKNFNAKRCAKDRKSASQNVGFLSLIANPSAPINWQGGWHPPPPRRARVKINNSCADGAVNCNNQGCGVGCPKIQNCFGSQLAHVAPSPCHQIFGLAQFRFISKVFRGRALLSLFSVTYV